jgi:hypothetical protein
MASGMPCCSETLEGGHALFEQYLDAAHAVLEHVPAGLCFGMVSILDTNTGKVEATGPLMGQNQETTLGRHPV